MRKCVCDLRMSSVKNLTAPSTFQIYQFYLFILTSSQFHDTLHELKVFKFQKYGEFEMSISRRLSLLGLTCVFSLFLASCSSTDPYAGAYQSKEENVGVYFSDLEMDFKNYEGPARNPVIVIHGFLGAKLRNIDDKSEIWGSFKAADIVKGYSDKYLEEISYPMSYATPLDKLKDNVKPYSMMTDVVIRVLGVNVKRNAYQDMLNIFIDKGFIPEEKVGELGKNFASLYPFFYDWRRDNVQNVQQLHEFIIETRSKLQKKYEELYGLKDFDVKFNIVAHSMGGLITRYYLMYGDQVIPESGTMPTPDWRGKKYVERVIIVGTPNLGYLNTCFEMTRGLRIDPRLPAFPPAVVGTWATYYQMLPFQCENSIKYADDPEGPAVNLYDPQVWIDLKWGLANPTQDQYLKLLLPNVKTAKERRKIALDHLTKCLKKAEKFSQALQANSPQPDDIAMFLFLGDSVETRRNAVVDRKTGHLTTTRLDGGDGVVLSTSARMATKKPIPSKPFQHSCVNWHSVVHLDAAHMGITESIGFGSNVTYYLMLLPVKGDAKRDAYLRKVLNGSEQYLSYFKKYDDAYQ